MLYVAIWYVSTRPVVMRAKEDIYIYVYIYITNVICHILASFTTGNDKFLRIL